MPKFLRVKIGRDQSAARTHYTYPPQYDPKKVIMGPVYETFNPANMAEVVGRGNDHEFCLIAVSDADAPQFLESPDIEEIDRDEMEQEGTKFSRPSIVKVVDSVKIGKILEKLAKDPTKAPVEVLDQNELNAIDPENAELGLQKTKTFSENLVAFEAKQMEKGG